MTTVRIFYCVCALFILGDCSKIFREKQDSIFDFLLFAQSWPITGCISWKAQNTTNFCTLPQNSNVFLIHGLWPTESGTSGPNFCRRWLRFDRKVLNPILDQMMNRWTNIQGGTDSYSFWGHEWKKHGTCAITLAQFNTEYKYFKNSLDLNLKYDLVNALAEYGIVPGPQQYTVDNFIDAIVKKYGKIPQIHCTLYNGESLLDEIRLCFDTSIKLIDCTLVKVNPRACSSKNMIKYLKTVSDD
ncbi:hypothetical protein HHI36_019710 [Cryptolaemus montrouzieri]|uniref:Uncharacterized protein n=1 Tax=Cryptolaemus montrouzieri TaxID=559131 RepID=A0ABD2N8V8_9CUCU